MTNKEIRIGFVRPSVGSEQEINIELEAALVELDGDIGLAIPNVTFKVRINVDNVFEGKSDAKFGIFKTPAVRIVKPTPELQIELTANDGVDTVVKNLRVNIATEIAKMVSADAIEAESKRRIKAEIREVQKKVKEGKAEIEQIRAAFGVLNKYSDHPLAAEVALEIAETNSKSADRTIEAYSHFKNAPWSETVMFKAAERAPLAVLGNIGKIKGEKWAARIVSMIAKWLPGDTIAHLADYIDMSWAFQIMLQIAEENPRDAFAGIENYEYQPWAKAVAEKAARRDYMAALEFYDLYKYQPWAQEIRNLAEEYKSVEEKSNPGMARTRAEYSQGVRETIRTVGLLKARFKAEKNKFLCPDLDFGRVERTLKKKPTAIQTLIKAERDGHEPTIYFSDETGFDIGTLANETPISTRNCLLDAHPFLIHNAPHSKFNANAKQQAAAMGWQLMRPDQGNHIFRNTPSYVEKGWSYYDTSDEIRNASSWGWAGGLVLVGRRDGAELFCYAAMGYNSKESYDYRGWRGSLRVNFVDDVREG